MAGALMSDQRTARWFGGLAGYQYLPAVKADLLVRLGRSDEAAGAYRRALELTANEAERAFLAERLVALGSSGTRAEEAALVLDNPEFRS
jgi:predicted RNA polymerase sigma factor